MPRDIPPRTRDEPRLCRVAGRAAWHIAHRGRRISTGCTDRAEALAQLARYRAAADLPDPGKPRLVRDILADYLADRERAEIPGIDRLRGAHKALRARLGDKVPEEIDATACRVYARAREEDGMASATARTELGALVAALHWAVAKHRLPAMPETWLPPRPPPRDRWLTREEAARLVAGCRQPHVRLFVLLALHTAARRGAILGLTWDRVDLPNRLIDFREPGKVHTRKRRSLVPINDTLATALATAWELHTCPAVVEYAGGPVGSIKHAFANAADRAKLPGTVTPHTLRHTAITWMVQAGVSLWEVAGFAGLTVQMIEDTYGHHAPDHLRHAAEALG